MRRMLLAAALLALSAGAAGGNAEAGKVKAGACVGCHGANGQGVASFPALAGKNQDELLQALKDYKSGKRANATMKMLAGNIKDEDMPDLAAYFAALKKK